MTETTPEAQTERVVMLWPKEVKEKVRQLAGARGITAFTLDAVNAKIEAQFGVVMVETSEAEREVLAVDAPAPISDAVHLTEAAEVTPLPHDRYAEVPKVPEERQRVIDNLKEMGLTPASQIKPPQPSDTCPKCQGELIDGECWSCS